jgi:hypothetical protein
MAGQVPIRRKQKQNKQKYCTFCGSTDQVESHHLGGRFHIAWSTLLLCKKHHDRVTEYLRASEVDMRYTPDKRERLRRARQAVYLFLWLLEEFEREGTKR